MNTAYANALDFSFFTEAKEQLNQMIERFQSEQCATSEQGKIGNYCVAWCRTYPGTSRPIAARADSLNPRRLGIC